MRCVPTRSADPFGPAFETKPCANNTSSPFHFSGISMRYSPPSYWPKNAFAFGSASKAGSPGCHDCSGHGIGVRPGFPIACIDDDDDAPIANEPRSAQARAFGKRTAVLSSVCDMVRGIVARKREGKNRFRLIFAATFHSLAAINPCDRVVTLWTCVARPTLH